MAVAILQFISAYLDHLAQLRRAASAAQQVQQPAQLFATSWNAGRLRLPADYLYSVQDPATGTLVQCAPWCDASVSDEARANIRPNSLAEYFLVSYLDE